MRGRVYTKRGIGKIWDFLIIRFEVCFKQFAQEGFHTKQKNMVKLNRVIPSILTGGLIGGNKGEKKGY